MPHNSFIAAINVVIYDEKDKKISTLENKNKVISARYMHSKYSFNENYNYES